MATQGIADEYMVSELTVDGELAGEPLRLVATGWGEDNSWEYMRGTGCVVFAFAWMGDGGPGANFPIEGSARTTKTMRLTSVCPTSNKVPWAPSTPSTAAVHTQYTHVHGHAYTSVYTHTHTHVFPRVCG